MTYQPGTTGIVVQNIERADPEIVDALAKFGFARFTPVRGLRALL